MLIESLLITLLLFIYKNLQKEGAEYHNKTQHNS